MSKLFSLIDNPPPGFTFIHPEKKILLTGHIALFVTEVNNAFSLLPDFCNRVQGLLITPTSSFSRSKLGPQLWHLTFPSEHLHLLQHFAGCFLDTMKHAYQENKRNIALVADMTYNSKIHFQTQEGYNRAMNRLQLMVEEAHFESEKRKTAITRLQQEIRKRKKAQKKQLMLEAQLHQSQKMEAIGLMAGGVAHDLNNILAGVVGYPDLLLLNLPEKSDLRQPLENIKESGKRAAEVVADLLTISRNAATPNTAANLNTIICEYLNSLEFKEVKSLHPAVTFQLNLDDKLANIFCSTSHIRKCLMNLIINGTEAISGKGTLQISTENKEIRQDKQYGDQVVKKGKHAVVRIQDSGKGIASEHLNHIFEPFYSRKKMGRSGTGIGLTVVWNTVQEHKGTIHIQSSSNGTTFELLFPTTRAALPLQTREPLLESLYGNQEIIMVVDDEKLLLNLAEGMLLKLNYQVITMGSGEAAIHYAQHHDIDLIVLDMIMDPGRHGRETYEKILTFRPNQQAIIVSGFAENEDVDSVLRLGASSFLRKPYTTNALGSAVKNALKRKKPKQK